MAIAVTDSAQIAIEYDRRLRNYAAELARERRGGVNFADLISTENELAKRRVISEITQESQTRTKFPPSTTGEGKKPDSRTSEKSRSAKSGKGSSYQNQPRDNKKGKNRWSNQPRGRSRSQKRRRSSVRPKSTEKERDRQRKKTENPP